MPLHDTPPTATPISRSRVTPLAWLRRLASRPHNSRRSVQILLTFVVLALTAFSAQPASALNRDGVAKALRATVQVIVPDPEFEIFSLGSGTILNNNGLILTNYHVVEGDRRNGLMNDDGLAGIAVAPADLRGESVLKYFGQVVKTSPELDLALIQIVSLADDPEAPLPDNLGLTPIDLGNSDDLMIGDIVNMFGYPGLGGNTPTYTNGIVSGFLDENRDGVYEWFKTDAELNHGNSGGLATDDEGRFIGVPTAGNADDIGKIGLVRTGNLALQFFNSYFPNAGGDGARVSNMQFAEAINRRGDPINADVQFETGITDLYAVFDFEGFTDGNTLTYVWYVDGFETARDAFPWDSGESGTSWVSVYDDNGLPDGFTEVELIYDGTSVYRGGVMVGEGSTPDPVSPGTASFGPITFAEDESGGQPLGAGNTFSGVDIVFAFFDYEGMNNGLPWTTHWYLDDQEVLSNDGVWDGGSSGSYYISLSHPDGLPAGRYGLELYVDGQLFQSGEFSVQEGGSQRVQDVGVIGYAHDRNNTRTAIEGALIVFLQPGYSIDDWIDSDFSDSMVHGSGTSNRTGDFQLDARVVPGEYYSVIVVHDDYEPIAVDDWQIPTDSVDPYELDVAMDRG